MEIIFLIGGILFLVLVIGSALLVAVMFIVNAIGSLCGKDR